MSPSSVAIPDRYLAFGLTLESDIKLPLPLCRRASAADINIRRVDQLQPGSLTDGFNFNLPTASVTINREGSEVLLAPIADAEPEAIALEILNTVMIETLFTRGHLCLHGGLITKDGITVAFIAPSGCGKSTTIAGLSQRGWTILSDDLVIIQAKDNELIVAPAYPGLRLWDSSIAALQLEDQPWHDAYQREGKYYRKSNQIEHALFEQSLPLNALFHLVRTERPYTLSELTGMDKFLRLTENQFAPVIDDSQLRKTSFQLMAKLAKTIPLYQVNLESNLNKVNEMSRCIDQSIQSLFNAK